MSDRSALSRGGVSSDFESLTRQLSASVQKIRDYSEFLSMNAADSRLYQEAMALHLARLGWLILELGNLWVLELRLGILRKDTECLEVLVRAGHLAQDRGRRLRMLAEYRLLVARDLVRHDRSLWKGPELNEELSLAIAWASEVGEGLGLRLP